MEFSLKNSSNKRVASINEALKHLKATQQSSNLYSKVPKAHWLERYEFDGSLAYALSIVKEVESFEPTMFHDVVVYAKDDKWNSSRA